MGSGPALFGLARFYCAVTSDGLTPLIATHKHFWQLYIIHAVYLCYNYNIQLGFSGQGDIDNTLTTLRGRRDGRA